MNEGGGDGTIAQPKESPEIRGGCCCGEWRAGWVAEKKEGQSWWFKGPERMGRVVVGVREAEGGKPRQGVAARGLRLWVSGGLCLFVIVRMCGDEVTCRSGSSQQATGEGRKDLGMADTWTV